MPHHDISGRYRGTTNGFEVRLRIDVDGPSPVNRVSADYYRRAGREMTPIGSMRVDAPVVTLSARQTTITGAAVFSFPTKCKRVSIMIPRLPINAPSPARASLRHVTAAGATGAVYDCEFESPSFRVVELEQACEKRISLPAQYDTTALSRSKPRQLTPVQAFAEAGIDMRLTGSPTIIDTSAAGPNATWSDAELQAAMQERFSRWGDDPRWAVWLLHAASHDDQQLAGLMFDQDERARQGCAVFYGDSADASPERLRHQLYTCVHELGHAFNLPHCWQPSLTDPPLPARPDALSWMNYPQRFPGGSSVYWRDFDFGFDEAELAYLRHAFELEVIMGGKPFSGTAVRDRAPGRDSDLRHDPGLRLKLSAPDELVADVPVTIDLELTATTRAGRQVPPVIGPRPGNVGIAIQRPDGSKFLFEPLLRHCRGNETTTLRAGDRPLRDSAFIHYGKRGFTFAGPGRYQLQALFAHPDGHLVVSNVASVRIVAPTSRVDRHISELIAGDKQVGKLLSLTGSDAPALKRGNHRLAQIVTRYPTHHVGMVARLAQATNLGHGFKRVGRDGTVDPRAPRIHEAAALVADVVEHQPRQRHAARPVQIRPGIDPSVERFFNSRIREITASASLRADASGRRARPSCRASEGMYQTGQRAV